MLYNLSTVSLWLCSAPVTHYQLDAGGNSYESQLFQGQLVGDDGAPQIWCFICPTPTFPLR